MRIVIALILFVGPFICHPASASRVALQTAQELKAQQPQPQLASFALLHLYGVLSEQLAHVRSRLERAELDPADRAAFTEELRILTVATQNGSDAAATVQDRMLAQLTARLVTPLSVRAGSIDLRIIIASARLSASRMLQYCPERPSDELSAILNRVLDGDAALAAVAKRLDDALFEADIHEVAADLPSILDAYAANIFAAYDALDTEEERTYRTRMLELERAASKTFADLARIAQDMRAPDCSDREHVVLEALDASTLGQRCVADLSASVACDDALGASEAVDWIAALLQEAVRLLPLLQTPCPRSTN